MVRAHSMEPSWLVFIYLTFPQAGRLLAQKPRPIIASATVGSRNPTQSIPHQLHPRSHSDGFSGSSKSVNASCRCKRISSSKRTWVTGSRNFNDICDEKLGSSVDLSGIKSVADRVDKEVCENTRANAMATQRTVIFKTGNPVRGAMAHEVKHIKEQRFGRVTGLENGIGKEGDSE